MDFSESGENKDLTFEVIGNGFDYQVWLG